MWARLLTTAIGIGLMAAPDIWSFQEPVRVSMQVTGPLLASTAIVAIWEIARPLRWAALPLGAWLALAPVLLDHSGRAAVMSVAGGLVAAALAFVRGRTQHHYGGGWSSLWRSKEPPLNPTPEK